VSPRKGLWDLSGPHAAVLDSFKDQLLIVLISRLGGDISVPISEVDGTGAFVLSLALDPDAKVFHFVVERKDGSPR
jgi:hypothetical protein